MNGNFAGPICSLLMASTAASQGFDYAFTQIQTATSPSPRMNAGLTFDTARNQWVLFGGMVGGTTVSAADTWLFDGMAWTQAQVTGPSPRYSPMAFDPVRQQAVLFGGISPNGTALGDTWAWDGVAWTQLSPATSPPARYGHCIAWDPSRGAIVLHGGHQSGFFYLDDTWAWDGAGWSQVAVNTPEHGGAMVYDLDRGVLVLFAGSTTNVYELVGSTWILRTSHPLGLFFRAGAYDMRTGYSLTFGGMVGGCTVNDRLIGYTGAYWRDLTVVGRPSAREGASMSADPVTGRVLLFGGRALAAIPSCTETFLGDLYWLAPVSPVASFSSSGSGCAGSAGTPLLDAAPGSRPVLGTTLSLDLTAMPANPPLSWAFGLLDLSALSPPVDLGLVGMPGCLQHVSLAGVLYFLTNVNGRSNWNLAMPPMTAGGLLGLSFSIQALVIDPFANAFGATVSNSALAVIGH